MLSVAIKSIVLSAVMLSVLAPCFVISVNLFCEKKVNFRGSILKTSYDNLAIIYSFYVSISITKFFFTILTKAELGRNRTKNNNNNK